MKLRHLRLECTQMVEKAYNACKYTEKCTENKFHLRFLLYSVKEYDLEIVLHIKDLLNKFAHNKAFFKFIFYQMHISIPIYPKTLLIHLKLI